MRDEEPGAIAQEVADCVLNDHGRRQILKVAPGAARLERKAFRAQQNGYVYGQLQIATAAEQTTVSECGQA